MARTPLLRYLTGLVSETTAARRAGVDLDELRERNTTSRREFLEGATLALVGTTMACSDDRTWSGVVSSTLRSERRVAIVGGGMAGLTAALTLADAGFASTIYEASPGRVGGRMMSDRPERPGCGSCHGVSRSLGGTWADGQVTDVFGEMIDGGHWTMRHLAHRYRLPLVDSLRAEPPGSTSTYWFGGGYYTRAEVDADYATIDRALRDDLHAAKYPTSYELSTPEGRALDAMSVYEWIESRVPGGHASRLGQLLDTAYAIEYGADTTDQSSLNLLYLLGYNRGKAFREFGPSDERFRIEGGIEELPRTISADLSRRGVPIEMDQWLESIGRRSDGTYQLSFSTASGSVREVLADIVVLAVPFSVVRNLDYAGAGFDALKERAITELGAGHNGKLQLQFSRRLWNEPGPWGIGNGSGYGADFQAIWEPTRGFAGTSGILVNYTGGSTTDAMRTWHVYGVAPSSSVVWDARTFLSRVDPVFPGLGEVWNGRAAASVAHKSPFFRCSYAYWRPGQCHTFGGYERVRQGNVFFAGEHTSLDYQGYMEGAASEGERAGKEILAELRGPIAARTVGLRGAAAHA
ncbi:MAG: FAD-dependent oxidoreductase [Deltaproteobacteria bacterium]|nr:FAD-dependent oxidoreductase [Deltaproteobacteria bacterium]